MRPHGLQAAIIRLSLRARGAVVALGLLVIAYGVYALAHSTYDVFPEFAPLQVNIQTEAAGFSPLQVETLVTRPIEAALEGATGQERLTSNSIEGLSIVTLYFDQGTNIYRDRQFVAERLAEVAGELPRGVTAPVITPLTSSEELVMVIGLTSDRQSLMRLRTLARWTLQPAITAVHGVADVEIFGGQTRAIEVRVHPSRLVRYGLGLDDVLAAARQAGGIHGAGFLSTPNQRIVLNVTGDETSAAALAGVVLKTGKYGAVTLGEVADVVAAPEPAVGAGAVDGVPAVVMNITEQYGANTLQVTRGLDAAFAGLRPVLARQGVVLRTDLFRPARFIQAATHNLGVALLIGAGLVVTVLFLFLSDLRSAAICCTAIPLSLLAAVAVLQARGISLNTMTLGGLAIALGEVVDDAVIAVENITRRLRDNLAGPAATRRPVALVVLAATFEVRSAVVYATFAVILVFLPVVTLSGVGGRLFSPLGVTYILAVTASLIVALTVTPALALMLLARGAREATPPALAYSRRAYVALLRRALPAPGLAVTALAAVTLGGAALLPVFSASFLPDLQEGHFVVHTTSVPGTSLRETERVGARVAADLLRLAFVHSVAQRAGRAALTADTHGVHEAEFEVELKKIPTAVALTAKRRILAALADFPGLVISANTFLTERIDETLSGYTAPFVVNVYGADLGTIDVVAAKVADAVQGVKGASGVEVQSPPGLPQLNVRFRGAALLAAGLTPDAVLRTVGAAYQGEVVGQRYEADRVFDIVVRLTPGGATGPEMLRRLLLRTPRGNYVTLGQVADVTMAAGLYEIEHDGGRRIQTVTADVEGRAVSEFAAAATRAIATRVTLPAGVYLQFTGSAAGEAQARRDLLFKTLLATIGILLLLAAVTRHWRNLVLVLVNLPFALVGGLVAAFLYGGVLSLGSLVGFVTLFGITLRNSLMMIAHFRHMTEVEGRDWNFDCALEAARDRLGAVLMTTLVTGLGLLPLVIGLHAPGHEIEGPMALVILGGLVTSMLLNLLLLPTLALHFGRFGAAAAADGLE